MSVIKLQGIGSRTMRRLAAARYAALLLATALVTPLAIAEELDAPSFGFTIDLPAGWFYDSGNDRDRFSFTSEDGKASLQIAAYDQAKSPWTDARSFGIEMARRLSSAGMIRTFDYAGRNAALMDLDFAVAGSGSRGFAVLIRGVRYARAKPRATDPAEADVALLAFCERADFTAERDLLLSVLDGFSADKACRLKSGPVSQQLEKSADAANVAETAVSFLGGSVSIPVDPNALAAAQALVEREYAVLESYQASENWQEAWKRFYRMIYRDSYSRLDRLAFLVGRELDRKKTTARDLPARLLSWIQEFEYVRDTNTADFVTPLAATVERRGDCDSLSMLYAILLNHLGTETVLLVSEEYSHAIAGVDTEGPGARFEFDGKKWLVAETTDDVAIGLIGESVSDPTKWLGIRFPYF